MLKFKFLPFINWNSVCKGQLFWGILEGFLYAFLEEKCLEMLPCDLWIEFIQPFVEKWDELWGMAVYLK